MLIDFLSLPLLFLLGSAFIKGTVLYVSQNNGEEAINGSSVELVCVTDAVTRSIDWYIQDHKTVIQSDNSQVFCVLESGCFPPEYEKYSFSTINTNQFVHIPEVNNHDENWWICVNSGNSLDAHSFYLYVKIPVTAVSMDTPGNLEVQVNKPHNISCSTSYGRPAADIKFYKEINGNSAEITQNVSRAYNSTGNGVTRGTLTYMPSRNDDGAAIYCRANNTITRDPVTAPNPVITLTIEPPDSPLVIKNHTNGSTYTLIENSTLDLTCSIKGGKPRPRLAWRCNGGNVVNESHGDETNIKVTLTAERNKDGHCQCISYHPAVSTNQSVSVNVDILYPPSTPKTFINGSEREGTVRVINNTVVPVTCSSSSKPPPSYTWWYMNSEETGSNISQRVIENSTLKCTVTNTMTVMSTNVTKKSSAYIAFHILYGPTKPSTFCALDNNNLKVTGQTVEVIQGENLFLKCSANGDPRPKYFWNGNEGENITVNITKDEVFDCVARNELIPVYGNKVSMSASTAVNVNRLYGPEKEPSIIYIHTDGQTVTLVSLLRVIENSSFSLTCNNSNGRPSPTYRWTGAASSMSGFLKVTDIKRSPYTDAFGISYYKYTCEVQNTMINTCGDRRHQKSTLNHNLTVDVLYPALLGSHQNQTAVEGTEVILTATVTRHGNPTETYKWLYSETKTGDKATLANNLIHTIQNISRNEAGFYSIEATNLIHPTGLAAYNKTVSQTFWLDVFYPTTISNFTIGGQQGNITYKENDTDIEVRCHVDSNPSSDMELHSKTHLEDGKIAMRKSTYTITYTIPITTCFDTGIYRCIGHNNYTKTLVSSEAHIFVRCTPRPRYLVNQNITVYKALNDSVTLSLSLIAYPEPSPDQFYWEKINGTITTSMTNGGNVNISVVNLESSLTIHSLQQTDFGQYRLMITNNISRPYSHYFFINPQDKPQAPTTFTHIQEILSATTAGFQWTPGFDGGLNQTFYVYYKKASDLLWNYTTALRNKVTLTGLVPDTLYNVKVFASNKMGNSSETNTLNFTTKEELVTSPPPLALIGGVAGVGVGLLLIVAVVFGVIFYRRTFTPKDSQNDQGRDSLCNDHAIYDEDGMEINQIYVPADSLGIQQPSTSRDVYAQVDKSRKTQNANVNDNVYAVVDKRKKKDNDATVQMDVYATPVKGKIGKKGKKGKGGKKKGKCVHEDAEEMNVYSNVGYENEAQQGNVYVNVEETRARKISEKCDQGWFVIR